MSSDSGDKSTRSVEPLRQRGLANWRKGRSFQEHAAALYELLGARVDRDIELCETKVDLLITFDVPGGSQPHRIIVECKNEQRFRNHKDRVLAMTGLLTLARSNGLADAAEFITANPVSEAAKGVARRASIGLFTYEEKLRCLIDFRRYLQSLKALVDDGSPARPGLATYYQPQPARVTIASEQPGDTADLLPWLLRWAEDDSLPRRTVVFGEYGIGKTSVARMLAASLARRHLEEPISSRIPLLINLRDYSTFRDVRALVTSFLDTDCEVFQPRFSLFQAMNEAGYFVLILDGLDEMSRWDGTEAQLTVAELEWLSRFSHARLLLTSRPEIFANERELEQVFGVERVPSQSSSSAYSVAELRPWSQQLVKRFLRKRLSLAEASGMTSSPETVESRLSDLQAGLGSLGTRPVFADLLVKTGLSDQQSLTPRNRADLYETHIRTELVRQRAANRRSFALSDDDRIWLMHELAREMYVAHDSHLEVPVIRRLVSQRLGLKRAELEPLTREFLSCSFLARRRGQFGFADREIAAYLLARVLVEAVNGGRDQLLSSRRIPPEVLTLLEEAFGSELRSAEGLLKWITATRYRSESGGWLGGNSVSILARLSPESFSDVEFESVSVRGADFASADLASTRFIGGRLSDVDVRQASFSESTFEDLDVFDGKCRIGIRVRSSSPQVADFLRSVLAPIQSKEDEATIHSGEPRRRPGEPTTEVLSARVTGTDPVVVATVDLRTTSFDEVAALRTTLARDTHVIDTALFREEWQDLRTACKDVELVALEAAMPPALRTA